MLRVLSVYGFMGRHFVSLQESGLCEEIMANTFYLKLIFLLQGEHLMKIWKNDYLWGRMHFGRNRRSRRLSFLKVVC